MSDHMKPLIMCIDDNSEWLALVERWLIGGGYRVVIADGPASALVALPSINPDLILLDVVMPGMDGYSFCAKLQSMESIAPIMFMTALNSEQDKARALAVGGVDYLIKPVPKEKLLLAVQRHLRTRQRWANLSGLHKSVPQVSRKTAKYDFKGFMDFLVRTARIPAGLRPEMSARSPDRMYAIAAELKIPASAMARHAAEFLNVPYFEKIDAADIELGVLPPSFCRTNHVVPIKHADRLTFVLSNPFNLQLLDDLQNASNSRDAISFVISDQDCISRVFKASQPEARPKPPEPAASMNDIESELKGMFEAFETVLPDDVSEESSPIILLVNKLMQSACELGASDIHLEPWENEVLVRFRIDGELQIAHRLRPQKLINPLSARIKIMSNLNITEKRLPQDGRLKFRDDIDMRVSVMPSNFGEKVVLRILDKSKSALPLVDLGFSERNLKLYREKIESPYGLILHVGPTGSGKSMTLFSALREIQKPQINIETLEDPIEYTLPGITQVQIHPEIGFTFQRGLRGFLRQDPDVILVGEIRDAETAHTAIEAALTGHLLFSTLHTNDAASTIVRLVEMGVEPYLISPSLVMICAQRLVRRLCEACKEPYQASSSEKQIVGACPTDPLTLHRARGCAACNGTGYKGRVGVHELLTMNDELRTAISRPGITSEALKRLAVETCGMTTMQWDAMEKVRQGITSVGEVISQIGREDFDSRPDWMRADQKATRVLEKV